MIRIRVQGRSLQFDPVEQPGPIPIGRDTDAGLAIDDPHVSARHGQLIHVNGRWCYQDLGSTNGSAVERSGRRSVVAGPAAAPWALEPGDRLLLGSDNDPVAIEVESLDADETAAAVAGVTVLAASRLDSGGQLAERLQAGGRSLAPWLALAAHLLSQRLGQLALVAELRAAQQQLAAKNRYLRERSERQTSDELIGAGPAMRQLHQDIAAVAVSDATVLISGPSGAGKELVARAIHQHSGRQQGPFVPVNCAGIPDTLLEAELFGYEAGAFTGASRSKPGRFARAEGGTLFLDEIGDMPMQLQAKLLRVLQDGTYEALGGVRARTADVRVVTATNRQLDTMVEQGTFRRDLYYRIKVFEIQLPPLHRRMEDVPLLVEHFIRRLAVERDKEVAGVTPAALQLLLAHDYPGNVRELYNAVIHGFVLTPNRLIDAHHLPSWLQPDAAAGPQPPAESLKDLERGFLTATLARHGNNRLATARALGIHKTTLYRKLHRLGVPLPDSDGRSHSGNGSGRG